MSDQLTRNHQMAEIAKKFRQEPEWIVVELNPMEDLLIDLAAKLYNEKAVHDIFHKTKINLSFWGIGVEIKGNAPITNIEVAISEMS